MNPSRRIAVVGACPYPVPQGSQVYLRETALAFERAGFEPRLVVYGYGIGDDESGLPLHRSGRLPFARRTKAGPSLAKPLLDIALLRTLRRVCKTHAIDAVSAHNYEGLLVAVLARRRPIVYHAHNAMQDELPTYFHDAGWARRAGAWLDANLPRRADACVVPHPRLRDYLVGCGCDSETVHVISPAIDAVSEGPVSERIPRPPVLYTGNLDAYQNLEFLAAAMSRVVQADSDVRLRIVSGDTLDGTPFAGAAWVDHDPSAGRDALTRALAGDAVFVCPRVSWSGYPMKLLNAMAAGQAIVCCASSAHPLTDGHDAVVVPDNDIGAFADAIQDLMRDGDLRDRLGAAARETFVKNHSPDAFAEALSRVYRGQAPDASG